MTGPFPRIREAGFTLIELLVSLAILSLVATMLLGGVSMAARLNREDANRSNALDTIVGAQTMLRSRIEQLHPLRRLDRDEPTLDLDGSQSVLSFDGPPADRDSPSALMRYRLMRTATGDLVLFSVSSLSDRVDISDRGVVGWTPIRVLSGIEDLSIAYFGPDPAQAGLRWQTFWWDRPRPPELVRIRVRFPEGDPRRWPELIIRPRASQL